jgi:hypothetical protein
MRSDDIDSQKMVTLVLLHSEDSMVCLVYEHLHDCTTLPHKTLTKLPTGCFLIFESVKHISGIMSLHISMLLLLLKPLPLLCCCW